MRLEGLDNLLQGDLLGIVAADGEVQIVILLVALPRVPEDDHQSDSGKGDDRNRSLIGPETQPQTDSQEQIRQFLRLFDRRPKPDNRKGPDQTQR